MMRFVLALLLSIGSADATFAQSGGVSSQWPDRPIHFLVPLPAGSAADVLARLVGRKLSERFGQPVIVENRSGASGTIGTDVVAKAKPDGYTFGIATSTTHVTAAILNPQLPYDPIKDFSPVAMIGVSPYVLVIHPSIPAHNVAELIAFAKTNSRTLSYSSVGEGSVAHLAGQYFAVMTGIALNHIPYRTSTQAIIDLTEGRIDMQFGILTTSHQFIKDGKLRALAVTTQKRVDGFPEIPTMAESGLPGYEANLWIALVAPAGTPLPIVALLNQEINVILGTPEIRKTLAAQIIQAEPSTTDQLRERIKGDLEKWRAIATKAGMGRPR